MATTPFTISDIITVGRQLRAAKAAEEEAQRQAAEKARQDQYRADWNKLETQLKSLLPEAVHPWITFDHMEDGKLAPCSLSGARLEIPSFAPIQFVWQRAGVNNREWTLTGYRMPAHPRVDPLGYYEGAPLPKVSWDWGRTITEKTLSEALAVAEDLGEEFAAVEEKEKENLRKWQEDQKRRAELAVAKLEHPEPEPESEPERERFITDAEYKVILGLRGMVHEETIGEIF